LYYVMAYDSGKFNKGYNQKESHKKVLILNEKIYSIKRAEVLD